MIEWLSKTTLLLAAVAAGVTILRSAPAAVRRSLLAAGVVGALALPVLPAVWPLWGGHSVTPGPSASSEELGVAAPTGWNTLAAPTAPTPEDAADVGRPTETVAGIPWLLALWGVGTCLLLARLVVDHRRVARLHARASRRPAPPTWARALARLGTLEVRWSAEIDTPMVVGLRRPALLLPDAASGFSEARALACVAHEGAHLAGHDTRLLFLADLLRALQWPNPFAWWTARRLRAECEHTADDAVLAAGTHRADYAELLLSLTIGPRRPLTAAVGAGGAGAEQRIVRVLDARIRPPRRFAAPAAAALIALVSAGIGCAGPEDPYEVTEAPAEVPEVVEGARLLQPVLGPDESLQAKVEEALLVHAADHAPVAASVVVVEVETGRVVALAGNGPRGDDTPLRAVEPASTLKPFAIAAALEAGIQPRTPFETAGGQVSIEGHVFRDAHPAGAVDLEDILVQSSNAGAAQVAQAVGPAAIQDVLTRFHLLPIESAEFTPLRAALATSGAGLRATPVQVALAYAALAHDGVDPQTGERVLSAETAAAVRDMLEAAVERGTGQGALVENLRVGGKTGTMNAQGDDGRPLTRATFVGIFPLDAPRWVVHVQVDTRTRGATGGQTAAPLFGRIAAAIVRGC